MPALEALKNREVWMAEYSFDNAWVQARQRLRGIEARYDPGTIRHLEGCGVAEGWHCLEIGGGGGSIAAWLCQRVRPSGYVLATDMDTRFLETLGYPNLEVRRHDIVNDDLPKEAFDLVHTRMVLSHLPERDKALQRMVAAVKRAGWLVCEDMDNISTALVSPTDTANRALYMKTEAAVSRVMAARGQVYDYGQRLYGLFCEHGLVDVQSEGRVFLRRTGSSAQVARLTVEQLREDIIGSRLATEAEIGAYNALLDNPSFVAVTSTLFATWGRRPAA